jgi:oligo-1,6-glucosidase
LSYYRQVIALRHELPVVVHGDFTMLLPDDERVYAFTRRLDNIELLTLANFSSDIVPVNLPRAPSWDRAELLLANYLDRPDLREVPVTLRAWEARVHTWTRD